IEKCAAVSYVLFENEQSVYQQLNEAKSLLKQISTHNPELKNLMERLESTQLEIKDIAQETEQKGNGISTDSGRLQFVEDRLNLLNQLKRKHGAADINELIIIQNQLSDKLFKIDSVADVLLKINKQIDSIEQELKP